MPSLPHARSLSHTRGLAHYGPCRAASQGLFRGVGSPAQHVGPAAFAPVAIGTNTADTDTTGNGDSATRSAAGVNGTATKGGNPKPE